MQSLTFVVPQHRDCSYRDIDWNEEKVREWCGVKEWQRSRKFEKDVARLEAQGTQRRAN